MPVKEGMNAIEATIEETLDTARKRTAKEEAKSRSEVYRKVLEEVQRVAGNDPMRALADWIRRRIRERENSPSGRDVHQKGG